MEGQKVGRFKVFVSFPLFPDTSTELSAAGAMRGVCNCIRTTIPSRPARPIDDDDDGDDDAGSNVKWQNPLNLPTFVIQLFNLTTFSKSV